MITFLRMTTLAVVALTMLGCDVIEKAINAPPKGSLDAVLLCMEENADKEKLIGEHLIERQCVEKHQLFSSRQPSESKQCGVRVYVKPKGISTIEPSEKCINTTDRMITSLNATITINNLSSDIDGSGLTYSETAQGKSSWTRIKPDENLHWNTIQTEHVWPEQVTGNEPYCSKKPDERCVSWSFTGYHYLKINI